MAAIRFWHSVCPHILGVAYSVTVRLTRKWFAVINPLMALVLNSPLHFLFSGNILLLTFTGRSSGRIYKTPVRYIRSEGRIRCFTSQRTRWWLNIVEDSRVELRISGKSVVRKAEVLFDNPEAIRPALEIYLRHFPQDAVYHDVRLNNDRTLNTDDLDCAAHNAVLIEAIKDC